MTNRYVAIFVSCLLICTQAFAAEGDDANVYRIGAYYGEDSSYASQLDADFSLTAKTRLQLGGTYVHSRQEGTTTSATDAYQAHLDLERLVGTWGFVLGGDYRTDDGDIKMYGLRGSTYVQTEQWRTSLSLARRRIEVFYDLPPLLKPFVDESQSTYSNSYGLSLRYAPNSVSLYASGTQYKYDDSLRNLAARIDPTRVPLAQLPLLQQRLLEIRARLNRINATSLRLADSLLDYSVLIGADYRIGDHLLNLEAGRDRAEVDSAIIDTLSVGWVLPIGSGSDVEVRIGNSHVDATGTTPSASSVFGSVSFSLYR
jgi:hypothetical protein